MKTLFISVFFIFLGTTFLFPQETDAQNNLLKRANENFKLISKNPDKAFKEAEKIKKEAQKIKAEEAELRTIVTKCEYFGKKNDFENMMMMARVLDKKSKKYNFPIYEVIAKRFLFESYLFTGLPDEALRVLKEGRYPLGKLDDTDTLNILERSNFFIAYSNYYLIKEDYKHQLSYIKLAGKEIEKLPKGDYYQNLIYVHYSNLATSYNKNNESDSAKHYAKLSQSLEKNIIRNDVTFNNWKVLGDAGMHEKNYKVALDFYKKAEKVKGFKNHIDVEELYSNIIRAYKKTGINDSARVYQAKKDSLQLTISENRNKSLHLLLNEKEEPKSKLLLYVLLILAGATATIAFFIIRKKKILKQQEKISQEYLEQTSNNLSGEDYSKLLKALKQNDPAFMIYFENTFPKFTSNLQQINPEITSSEIEFCSLLKLKTPTKEIAKYKFVEPKTVRNRKYLIRKKLNIPKEIDIYQWFDSL